jgi:RND family efflux transporter MFP subunit
MTLAPLSAWVACLALSAPGLALADPVRVAFKPAAAVTVGDPVRALLVPQAETTLSSPVAGTIRSIHAVLGSSFGSGQLLVHFECDEPKARLAMAQAEQAGAIEQHEAKVRMQGLEQASDLEVALAASAVAKARAQVALSQAQISQCTVAAPWTGRVSRLHARSHMSVTPGQPLLDLVRSGPLKLKLNAPSRWVAQIKPGSRLSITVDETAKSYPAKIVRINSRVDPASQTVEMEAQLDSNFSELLPGMSGIVAFADQP